MGQKSQVNLGLTHIHFFQVNTLVSTDTLVQFHYLYSGVELESQSRLSGESVKGSESAISKKF